MNQPKQQGSTATAVGVVAVVILALSSMGYYQYVYVPSIPTSTSSTAFVCKPPSCVTIDINFGAAGKTTDAYSPYPVRLVIGVNNTFVVYNNDSENGGVFHSATYRGCPQNCLFDTGVIGYNVTKGPFTLTNPGTYDFYCVVHPTTMRGEIIVTAGSGTPPPSSTTTQVSGSATSQSTSETSTTAVVTTSSSASSSGGATSASSGAQVSILNGAGSNQSSPGYGPDTLTVVIGVNNTVTWTNNDQSPHTVTSNPGDPGSFDSGNLNPGQAFTYTFTTAGTYDYHCNYHPWMKGTVIVKG